MAATHLHFDCYSGISGDMTLGALVDLGAPIEEIERRLKGLPIGPFSLRTERVKRQGIMGTKVHVEVEEDPHAHRHLSDVLGILEAAALSPRTAERARKAYQKLAEAEAHVHGTTPEAIHFHEVGAKDAILDVAGAMVGMELLGLESFSTSPVTVGSGMVKCHHGLMPVPAPATAELLKGVPQVAGRIQSEMVTPTGAAILTTLLGESPEAMRRGMADGLVPVRIGYGAGDKTFEDHANFLRLALCEAVRPERETDLGAEPALAHGTEPALPVQRHAVLVLETEVDDMSPELAGYLMDRLLADGALDVQFSPVQMKKNRPALRVRVLCDLSGERVLAERIFRETSTFGLRRQVVERWCLERWIEAVQTPLGPAQVKVGVWDDEVLKVTPEYETCRELAEKNHLPLSQVYEIVRLAIRERYGR